jgi:hypothetical protein
MTGPDHESERAADARHLDRLLDQARADSFPASDPVAVIFRHPRGPGAARPTPPDGWRAATGAAGRRR